MNRRNFFSTLATAVAGFTILPPATTYTRIWKATRPVIRPVIFIPREYWGTWHWVELFENPKYPEAVRGLGIMAVNRNISPPDVDALCNSVNYLRAHLGT